MKISAIVATGPNNGIGAKNKLLFYTKSDMNYFKKITKGSVVVMGRKTYESLPNGPLKNRTNIVLTRDRNYVTEDGLTKNSKKEVLNYLKKNHNGEEVFIIGGAKVYDLFLDVTDVLYITHYLNNDDSHADTFFPKLPDRFLLTKAFVKHDGLVKEELYKYPHVYTIYVAQTKESV